MMSGEVCDFIVLTRPRWPEPTPSGKRRAEILANLCNQMPSTRVMPLATLRSAGAARFRATAP
jgi:hypothetical protein